jgi:hypothetical protein
MASVSGNAPALANEPPPNYKLRDKAPDADLLQTNSAQIHVEWRISADRVESGQDFSIHSNALSRSPIPVVRELEPARMDNQVLDYQRWPGV